MATVYMVCSEECYGIGIRGVFGNYEKAVAFARSNAKKENFDYQVVETVLDAPKDDDGDRVVATSSGQLDRATNTWNDYND